MDLLENKPNKLKIPQKNEDFTEVLFHAIFILRTNTKKNY